jgi:hypothetical protein
MSSMTARQPVDDGVRDALSRPMTVVDITTTGEQRRLEIVLHTIGGRLYISGQPSRRRRSWLANLEANPHRAPSGGHADRPGADHDHVEDVVTGHGGLLRAPCRAGEGRPAQDAASPAAGRSSR